jgi:hypothetical protein
MPCSALACGTGAPRFKGGDWSLRLTPGYSGGSCVPHEPSIYAVFSGNILKTHHPTHHRKNTALLEGWRPLGPWALSEPVGKARALGSQLIRKAVTSIKAIERLVKQPIIVHTSNGRWEPSLRGSNALPALLGFRWIKENPLNEV